MCGIYGKWNISFKRKWKTEISCYEKQKCCTFSLIERERGKGISVKITECHLSLLHYSPLWQCNNSTQNSSSGQTIWKIFFKDIRKSYSKLFFGGSRGGGQGMKGLSDFYFFFFFLFSYRLFIQVCGHIFIIRILLLALRQSIQGCGHTTSVQIPKRIWMAGSGLWIKLLLCKHTLHWRGKFNTETVGIYKFFKCIFYICVYTHTHTYI